MIKIDIEGFKYKATSGDQKIFNTVNIMAVTCIYGMDISQRERENIVQALQNAYTFYTGMTKFISQKE
ncbi:hypothetical protein KUTeg_015198 [Tegillarca granosa]|uniref:Uncharacterized protein n=1 Tax=Tegillarca granosa TaxID=220873 RepID=A0ABQ9EPG3_TEGGR|nr:hypothetical protein KUTeg_015189 [Tegillarca granosa]KAJ8307114.1 hypothetical protein KUTeg_015198 [Tegillarca granosa]